MNGTSGLSGFGALKRARLQTLCISRTFLAGAAARVTWTDLLALAPGREDLSTLG